MQEVEDCIDQTLKTLPLFRFPRYQAISAVLADFEFGAYEAERGLGRLSHAAVMDILNRKPAAAILALQAWQSPEYEGEPPDAPDNALTLASEASLFAVAYSLLCEIFPAFHRGELKAARHDRNVDFQYVSPKARTHDALNFLSQAYKRRHPPSEREDVQSILSLRRNLGDTVIDDIDTSQRFPLLALSEQTLAVARRVPQWSWAAVLAHHDHGEAVRPGRNSRCPCGSGVKFKRCCYLVTRSNSYTWSRIASEITRPTP